MAAQVSTVAFHELAMRDVEVRCEARSGMSRLVVVGLDEAAEESRDRVQSALAALGLSLPHKRITISLAPLDLPKEGSHYDLPIALAVLATLGLVSNEQLDGYIVIGELERGGQIIASPHGQLAAQHAEAAKKGLICAASHGVEASGVPVISASNLFSLLEQLKRKAGGPQVERRDTSRSRRNKSRARDQGTGTSTGSAGESPAPKPNARSLWKRLVTLFERDASEARDPGHNDRTAESQDPSSSVGVAQRRVASAVSEDQARYDFAPQPRVPEHDTPAPRTSNQRRRSEPEPNLADGQRRLQLHARLIEGGPEALSDEEVLEFILFGARRHGDTDPMAKALMSRFGSLSGVFQADPTALRRVAGVGDHTIGVIKINAVAARRMAHAQLRAKPVLSDWDVLIEYLALDMVHLTRERVRVLYLDDKAQLVKDEHISEGTIDEASVHPREVIHHALDCGASALIMVHNHPSGNPEPSRADIQLTHRVAEAGRLVGVSVRDHVIVGRGSYVSLRARGLI